MFVFPSLSCSIPSRLWRTHSPNICIVYVYSATAHTVIPRIHFAFRECTQYQANGETGTITVNAKKKWIHAREYFVPTWPHINITFDREIPFSWRLRRFPIESSFRLSFLRCAQFLFICCLYTLQVYGISLGEVCDQRHYSYHTLYACTPYQCIDRIFLQIFCFGQIIRPCFDWIFYWTLFILHVHRVLRICSFINLFVGAMSCCSPSVLGFVIATQNINENIPCESDIQFMTITPFSHNECE